MESTPSTAEQPVHPIFEGFCRAFSGDATRPAANTTPGLNRYWVRVIRAGVVEHQFEAMAPDSMTCGQQHAGLAEGAKLSVMTVAAWEEKLRCERAVQRELNDSTMRWPG